MNKSDVRPSQGWTKHKRSARIRHRRRPTSWQLKNMSPTSTFDRLLHAEQLANALKLNIVRLVGVSVFLFLELLPANATSHRLAQMPLTLLTIYVGVALMLMLLARKSARVARVSRLAIPFLDMPMLFFIQHFNLLHAAVPRGVGNFTLAIYIIYILLAALSLDRWQIALAAATAATLQLCIHLQAGESLHGIIGGAFLLFLVTAMCDLARRQRLEMVWALCGEQLRRERLGRYFSPQVATEIEKNTEGIPDAQLCEVTVLFSDLRDFTALAERLDTSTIVTLLNDYFEHMVSVVFEHGGTLDKYIGDGLMVYFGAPVAQDDHGARAVRCAMAMRQSLIKYNAARSSQPLLRMGIGIHSGTAVVGSIGASHRREYTAIGDTVNLAARIQELCKTCKEDILVSLATKSRASSVANFREVTDCTVKGRTAPVQIFTPVHPDGSGVPT